MKFLLKAESVVPFLIVLVLINQLPVHFSWWVWVFLFLAPDLSMVGYALGNRTGAWVYNLFHHQLTAVVLWGIGWLMHAVPVELAGLLLLGHSSLDRVMGYGLKHETGFGHTHMGIKGRSTAKAV